MRGKQNGQRGFKITRTESGQNVLHKRNQELVRT